jgi:A/G-specific adenine glycosylase
MAALERAFAPIGLCHQRAVGIKCAATYVLDHYGKIPSDLDQLESVPNLGPYSARAMISFAFGEPYAMVDSDVARIVSRFLLLPKPSLALVQQFVDRVVPKKRHQVYNWAMLDLGAPVCKYGSVPSCQRLQTGSAVGARCQ